MHCAPVMLAQAPNLFIPVTGADGRVLGEVMVLTSYLRANPT